MRVITGKSKGMKLKTIEGLETRPTLDRIKVTMFDLVPYDFQDKVVLDLFSGSGALGIEALSRGARECNFVDMQRECIKVINENLEHTKLNEFANIHNTSVDKAIELFTNSKKFDMIFMDPPYDKGYLQNTLDLIERSNILNDDGIIVLECASYEKFESNTFKVMKERIFNKMAIYILEKNI